MVESSGTADTMDTADTSTKNKGPAAKIRRTFDAPDHTIAPYKRKLSLSKFDFEIYSNDPPPRLEKAKKNLDLIWSEECGETYAILT